jgi:formylglycine-generating enzyme required for sulfatase activity
MSAESTPHAGGRVVFISFASHDLELADRILERLERDGIRCWIAHRDIAPGTSYPAAIGSALASAGAVLLILTESSNRSPHVLRETEMAFNARTPILPLKMSGVEPSADLLYFLSMTQWVDAGATFDDADGARTEAALRTLLDRQPLPRHPGRTRTRRGLMIAGGAAALAAIALLIWMTGGRPTPRGSITTPERPASADERLSSPADGASAAASSAPAMPPSGGTPASATPDRVRTKVNPRDGQTYVWIPPGRFTMGCSSGDPSCDEDEKPAHGVRIAKSFWLGRTEVTAAQYEARENPNRPRGAGGDLPAAELTWAQAKSYCASIGGRLPTEAEWEYAARAGTATRYYDMPSAVAWYEGNSGGSAHPVAMKEPNAFGLYDMLGNVAEWVRDRYFNAYDDSGEDAEIVEPLASNASAVARGGSWSSDAKGIRVSRRLDQEPDATLPIIGVRCAHDSL